MKITRIQLNIPFKPFIFPEYLENNFKTSLLINDIIILGNNKSYLLALIIINQNCNNKDCLNDIWKICKQLRLKLYEYPLKVLNVENFDINNRISK